MIRTRLIVVAALVAAAVAALSATSLRAQSPTAPTVTLDLPIGNSGACDNLCLRGAVTLRATPTAASGRTVASVAFEYARAGTNAWTRITTRTPPQPFTLTFDTATVPRGFGDYDFRAVVTDSTGEEGVAVARDRAIANNNTTYVHLVDPGELLPGTVTLRTVVPAVEPFDPSQARFQISAAGAEQWREIGFDNEPEYPNNRASFSVDLKASDLPGGRYDLRALVEYPDDPTVAFVTRTLRDRLVDGDAPQATVTVPPAPLRGVVRLDATAEDPSGIATLRFERRPAGSDTWTAIDTRVRPPYSVEFDSRAVADGSYDFRVTAVDRAGNAGSSPVAEGVPVSNPDRVPPGERSVVAIAAPATNLKPFGTTSSGETWALGITTAGPAVVDGIPLVYPAQGRQLVILRYTERGGWQIRDVLRDEDGNPVPITDRNAQLQAAMTPSGEAWIALRHQRADGRIEGALFHRAPDGQFLRDAAASRSERLATLLAASDDDVGSKRLQLGETDGRVYGLLAGGASPTTQTPPEPLPDGGTATVRSQLEYALLDGETWTHKTLARPRGVTLSSSAVTNIRLARFDLTGPGQGWVVVEATNHPLLVGRLSDGPWDPIATGLDALDDAMAFGNEVTATGLRADATGVWLGAEFDRSSARRVVARFDVASGEVTRSWCGALRRTSLGCGAPLNAENPAVVPDQVFETARGPVGVALGNNFLHLYEYGQWTRVGAPGFSSSGGNRASLIATAPEEGWLGGTLAFGRITPRLPADGLATWPQANRSTLLSVALPRGSRGGVDETGALAVGLDGTALGYDASAGWQVQATPPRANRQALRAVAYNATASAFAVGGAGIILRWDGSRWTEDPQSTRVTTTELQSVAFGADGKGWAVGRFATILHFDGTQWVEEVPPPEAIDAGATISSVTVAGDQVFAIADGELIERGPGGTWQYVPRSALPAGATDQPLPFAGDLRVVSGLPDGGVVVAGRSVVLIRQRPGERFAYAAQPIEGVAVAVAAMRDSDGVVRAFTSVAATVEVNGIDTGDVGGFPPGDGVLLRQTADGWVDLSRSQPPGRSGAPEDGYVKPDPVLAVAATADGRRAWAVGGYGGTRTAAGFGTDEILPARAIGWRTAHVWRYDADGAATSPTDTSVAVSVPARPNSITFAYFSDAQCKSSCAETQRAQPDINLEAAARQIEEYAHQPGGPAFAMLGANARGPADQAAWERGNGADDFLRLPSLLAPLKSIPLFAGFGGRDTVPGAQPATGPWSAAFAQASAPFGSGPAARGITPLSTGPAVGAVHRYYAFDASQNGAVMRAIVVDNSAGTPLGEAQSAWLGEQLVGAKASGLPTVVFLSQPLTPSGAPADLDLLFQFVSAEVLAIFAAGPNNGVSLIPSEVAADVRIPQITGGSLGYQRTLNNGVVWYLASIDVSRRFVTVDGVPLLDSLALKPLLGLTTPRSSTLAFEALGRRPTGTLATDPIDPTFPGFDNYAAIPAPPCTNCIGRSFAFASPRYRFESADPTIGDFVQPSANGSRYPLLDRAGKPIPSATSGLFCGYNSGATTVSVTVGTRKASLPITVLAGGFGRPCGTVFREGQRPTVFVPRPITLRPVPTPGGEGAPNPPPTTEQEDPPADLPELDIPFPPPPPPDPAAPERAEPDRPRPQPTPAAPVVTATPAPPPPPPDQTVSAPPTLLPLIPPNIQPIPPGGSASAQATARRKEKVRQHAKQSAFTTIAPGQQWFYGAVGVTSVLTLLLIAGGVRPGPRRRSIPAPAMLRLAPARRERRR